MIKILDKNGKTAFVVNDNDTEPVPVEKILDEEKKKAEEAKQTNETEKK